MMTDLNAIHTAKICRVLFEALGKTGFEAEVHSSFQHAVNLSSQLGLTTLLYPGKCLQPGSVVLSTPMNYHLKQYDKLTVCQMGIYINGIPLVTFQDAQIIDLRMDSYHAPSLKSIHVIRDFLSGHMEDGLVSLAFNKARDPFGEFLAPRLLDFRKAVWEEDCTKAAIAARRMAGCGMGLTPSSDDLLSGYLAVLPDQMKESGLTTLIAESAACGTNDISANLLRWSGKNYFSEDILTLKKCLCENRDISEQRNALQSVANFGSSSGCDFLTGSYLGLLDTYSNGGTQTEEI